MKELAKALAWLAANQEAILVILAALASLLGGKAKKGLIRVIEVFEAYRTIKSGSQSHGSVVADLPQKSSLNLEQARNIIVATPNGGVKIKAVPLAMSVLSSGDGRKITRKVGKWFKKVF